METMTENITQFWNSPGAYLKVKFETEKVYNSTNTLGSIHDSDIGCNDEFTHVGAKNKVKNYLNETWFLVRHSKHHAYLVQRNGSILSINW